MAKKKGQVRQAVFTLDGEITSVPARDGENPQLEKQEQLEQMHPEWFNEPKKLI